MAKQDLRINKHGVNVASLKPGQWIELEFTDAPPATAILLEVESRRAAFTGERRLNVFITDDGQNWRVFNRVVHTQVTRIMPVGITAL